MKTINKITGLALGMAVVLSSCSKEGVEAIGSDSGKSYVRVTNNGSVTPLDEPMVIQGKTESTTQRYRYKGFANKPTINGVPTNAVTADQITVSSNNYFFVGWQTVGPTSGGADIYGGAISAYKYDGVSGEYVFTKQVEFTDANIHEILVEEDNGNVTVYFAGQRDLATSGHLLNDHRGAVVAKVTYDVSSDDWLASSFEDLALPGFGANGLTFGGSSDLYVVTGNGNGGSSSLTQSVKGGIYRIADRSTFSLVTEKNDALGEDYEFIINGGSSGSEIFALERDHDGSNFSWNVDHVTNAGSGTLSTAAAVATTNFSNSLTSIERNAMDAFSNDNFDEYLFVALGDDGLAIVKGNLTLTSGNTITTYNYGPAVGVEYADDASTNNADLIYYCGGTNGLWVMAGDNFMNGANVLVSDFDLIGRFTPPVGGGTLPSVFDIQDIAAGANNRLVLAGGLAGVYFVEHES